MAGESAERQETGVVNAINNAIKRGKSVTVLAGKTKISNVNKAYKYTGRQASGSEPYTDVVLLSGAKRINLSLKGESAPSLAGGGLRGLEAIIPGIAGKFMKAAHAQLIKDGLRDGDKVPDVYGKISDTDKVKIVVGNTSMGGPIHYMYIGPMDVTSEYDASSKTIKLNGTLTEAKTYAKTHDLFFRLRARREDQTFDSKAKDTKGSPKIYGKSPSRGDSAGRIVITSSVPKKAKMVKIK